MNFKVSCVIISLLFRRTAYEAEASCLSFNFKFIRYYEGVVFSEEITAPFCVYRKEVFMKNQKSILKLSLSAMLLALAFVMPFLTGQIPQIGLI